MSWDVEFTDADGAMGNKASVREKFLSACEEILGTPIQRQGPTEQFIHDSFRYETGLIGPKHATKQFTLAFQIRDGDPSTDASHPVWAFIRQIAQHTGWIAVDSYDGKRII